MFLCTSVFLPLNHFSFFSHFTQSPFYTSTSSSVCFPCLPWSFLISETRSIAAALSFRDCRNPTTMWEQSAGNFIGTCIERHWLHLLSLYVLWAKHVNTVFLVYRGTSKQFDMVFTCNGTLTFHVNLIPLDVNSFMCKYWTKEHFSSHTDGKVQVQTLRTEIIF